MSYPGALEYNEAVQNPEFAFFDQELKTGSVETTPLGLPLAMGGTFALTYGITCGTKKYAVRCFTREVSEIRNRYSEISKTLKSLSSIYFVSFDFQNAGIKIKGKNFPIVKMDWVDGLTLNMFLDKYILRKDELNNLQRKFRELSNYLKTNNIAHGDIQNGNIIIKNGTPKLIDYDGMFVSGLPLGSSNENGHKHFQHPNRSSTNFGPELDRFSFIALDLSLEALQYDHTLYKKFCEGGEAIIFKANDYADPNNSEIFKTLNSNHNLAKKAADFAAICESDISEIPTLSDFIIGNNIPKVKRKALNLNSQNTTKILKYISTYNVIDGADYDLAFKNIGVRVELIGKIVSVKEGIGKRGKGRNKPYVFINFGNWQGQSVKLTIWSDGLGSLNQKPSEAWIGKWISAVGLIDPPYEGKHYGKSYTSIGITISDQNQLVHLTADEALFRLGKKEKKFGPNVGINSPQGVKSNIEILKTLPNYKPTKGNKKSNNLTSAPQVAAPITKNQAILQSLGASNSTQQTSKSPSYTPNNYSSNSNYSPHPDPPPKFLGIPIWLWIIGIILFAIVSQS